MRPPAQEIQHASAFDAVASRYEQAMERSCAVSGETPQFYAEQRMRWCARRLTVPVETALDFGCGVGGSFRYFFEILGCKRVIGVDTSVESLRVARDRHGDLELQLNTPAEIVPNGDVSFAFCNGVFHHIPPAERLDALDYIRRSMAPQARFAFWENNPWNPVVRYSMSMTEFDRDAQTLSPLAAVRLLKRAGFRILVVDFRFFFPRFAKGLRALEAGLTWCPLGAQYLVLAQKQDG
jgi:SAM-dependent methyltransferase